MMSMCSSGPNYTAGCKAELPHYREPNVKLRDFFSKPKQIGLLEKVSETGAKCEQV